MLNLMQVRGRVTAGDMAAEFEISERTARRDLDALIVAGFPVVATRGRHGGWHLVGSGRTDLSGLTEAEASALAMATTAVQTNAPEVAQALAKLLRAVPEPFRVQATRASQAFLIEPGTWTRPALPAPPPSFDVVRRTILERRVLSFVYHAPRRAPEARSATPLGVVRTSFAWYVLAETERGRRTFRLDRIHEPAPAGPATDWPDGFSLVHEWEQARSRIRDLVTGDASVVATGKVHPDRTAALGWLSHGNAQLHDAAPDEWRAFRLATSSLAEMIGILAGLGAAVRVDQTHVRAALAEHGAQLLATHGARIPVTPTQ